MAGNGGFTQGHVGDFGHCVLMYRIYIIIFLSCRTFTKIKGWYNGTAGGSFRIVYLSGCHITIKKNLIQLYVILRALRHDLARSNHNIDNTCTLKWYRR